MSECLPPLCVVLLSLYVERPRHPYDAYTTLKSRHDDRFVAFSPGTVYRRVKSLSEAGLLEEVATEVDGNRPERTVYAVTDQGRQALTEALRRHLVEAEEEVSVRIALSEAHHLPEAEVADLLRARTGRLNERADTLVCVRKQIDEWNVPRGYVLDLDLVEATLNAERKVIASMIDDLDTGRLRWPAPGSYTPPPRTQRKPS